MPRVVDVTHLEHQLGPRQPVERGEGTRWGHLDREEDEVRHRRAYGRPVGAFVPPLGKVRSDLEGALVVNGAADAGEPGAARVGVGVQRAVHDAISFQLFPARPGGERFTIRPGGGKRQREQHHRASHAARANLPRRRSKTTTILLTIPLSSDITRPESVVTTYLTPCPLNTPPPFRVPLKEEPWGWRSREERYMQET